MLLTENLIFDSTMIFYFFFFGLGMHINMCVLNSASNTFQYAYLGFSVRKEVSFFNLLL